MSQSRDEAREMEFGGPSAKHLAKNGGRPEPYLAKDRRRKGRPTSEELAAELAAELTIVRAMLKESGENLLRRLDAQVVTLSRSLDGEVLPHEEPLLAPAEDLASLLAQAKALKVKPHKGRLKDLGRIEDLLQVLASSMYADG